MLFHADTSASCTASAAMSKGAVSSVAHRRLYAAAPTPNGSKAVNRPLRARAIARYVGEERVLRFPERADVPFAPKKPDARVIAQRMEAAWALQSARPVVVVASAKRAATRKGRAEAATPKVASVPASSFPQNASRQPDFSKGRSWWWRARGPFCASWRRPPPWQRARWPLPPVPSFQPWAFPAT